MGNEMEFPTGLVPGLSGGHGAGPVSRSTYRSWRQGWSRRAVAMMMGGLCLVAGGVLAQDWRALEREKRYDEALALLQALAVREPAKEAQYSRAAVDMALDRLNRPESVQAVVDAVRDPAWRAFLQFYVYQKTGRPDEALKSLEVGGIERFPLPAQTEAYLLLGNIRKSRKEPDKALEAYLKSVESKGGAITHWSWACRYAADIHMARGETAKAVDLYRRCLERKTFLASRNECLFAWVNHLLKENKTAEALVLLEAEKPVFDRLDSGHWKVVFFMEYARMLNRSGKRVQAIDTYDLAEKSGASEDQRKRIEQQRNAIALEMVSEL